jgi:hypothetical protein
MATATRNRELPATEVMAASTNALSDGQGRLA